jgi:hypothetical protein
MKPSSEFPFMWLGRCSLVPTSHAYAAGKMRKNELVTLGLIFDQLRNKKCKNYRHM